MEFFCKLRKQIITEEQLESGLENCLPMQGIYHLFHEKETALITEKQGVLFFERITDIDGNEIETEPFIIKEEDLIKSISISGWKRIGSVLSDKREKKYKEHKVKEKAKSKKKADENQTSLF